jgi:hypothetical protein
MDGPAAVKSQSAIEYLTTYGWALILLSVALVALFELGVFNTGNFINTSCIFQADFQCQTALLYSNGTVIINLEQNTQSAIVVTALGCNDNGIITGLTAPLNPPSNTVTLQIGSNATFYVPCYENGTLLSLSPGEVYKGYVLVNYTNSQTQFQHTATGTLVAKVQ